MPLDEGVTIGELGRLFADLKVTVDRMDAKLDGLRDHFVPREVFDLFTERWVQDFRRVERAEERLARQEEKHEELVRATDEKYARLMQSTISKKSVAGLLSGTFAAMVGVGTLLAVFLH